MTNHPYALWSALPPAQRNLLRALAIPMTTQEVADMMGIEYQRAAAFLYRLHQDGLIQSFQKHGRTALGDQTVEHGDALTVTVIPFCGRINEPSLNIIGNPPDDWVA